MLLWVDMWCRLGLVLLGEFHKRIEPYEINEFVGADALRVGQNAGSLLQRRTV